MRRAKLKPQSASPDPVLGVSKRNNVSGRLETDTLLIRSLIDSIKRGEVKIPQFQRRFVWTEKQALDLLDSIANNFPVGSLLLWRTTDKLVTERNIGEFKLPQTDDMSPTEYVLDGQQRMTVVYSCLGAPEHESGFSAVYDLEKEVFLKTPPDLKLHQFPIRKMFSINALLNFRSALQTLDRAEEYQSRLEGIVNAFSDYRFPRVTLKDLTVDEVCPIFERINSSGTKLSVYDLMVAATWSKDFDLDTEVEKIRRSLGPKGYDDIRKEIVLKSLTAIELNSTKEQNIKSLRDLKKDKLDEIIQKTRKSLAKTVDLLSVEFNLYSWDFLSYEALAIIPCYIYALADQQLSPAQVVRMRQWFWRASFSERYRQGGENFVSNDLLRVQAFVLNDVGAASDFGSPPREREWASIMYRSNVSRTRAFILALAANRPYNLLNGAAIDTEEALSEYNDKQFHHVYPRAYLKRNDDTTEDNSLANIIMLTASANRKISDSAPSIYIPKIVTDLGSHADEVFKSNLLPTATQFDYKNGSYREFLVARAPILTAHVTKLCDGKIP